MDGFLICCEFCFDYVALCLICAAQSNLLKSSILVVGAGGLGSPALLYLAACGVGVFCLLTSYYIFSIDDWFRSSRMSLWLCSFVICWTRYVCWLNPGRLGIVDNDVVELNNMHRQVHAGICSWARSQSLLRIFTFLAVSPLWVCDMACFLLLRFPLDYPHWSIYRPVEGWVCCCCLSCVRDTNGSFLFFFPKFHMLHFNRNFIVFSINSTVQIVEHREALRTSNALEILSKYDWRDNTLFWHFIFMFNFWVFFLSHFSVIEVSWSSRLLCLLGMTLW